MSLPHPSGLGRTLLLVAGVIALGAVTLSAQPLPAPPHVPEPGLAALRERFAKSGFRLHAGRTAMSFADARATLTETGGFADLDARWAEADAMEPGQARIRALEAIGIEALARIYLLADAGIRKEGVPAAERAALIEQIERAVLHHGAKLRGLPDVTGRFHGSCFAVPTQSLNIYFALFPAMREVEQGRKVTDQRRNAWTMLRDLAFQAWTLPGRKDATDADPIQVERLRGHVWWVGGNALTYRPMIGVAAMLESARAMEVLTEVAYRSISVTSYSTRDRSFWDEGITADGGGWGHGRQAQVFAYPLGGLVSAIELLTFAKGTPWERQLNREQVEVVMNYLRGSSWYQHRLHVVPLIYRSNAIHEDLAGGPLPTLSLARRLRKDFEGVLLPAEIAELDALIKLAPRGEHAAVPAPPGAWSGIRHFWNQDDLIRREADFHVLVNQSSFRAEGLESASSANAYNYAVADGTTLFSRRGDESRRAIGSWDFIGLPGITSREGEDQLGPTTNWRGYRSAHPESVGIADDVSWGAIGFRFEKANGADAPDQNDSSGSKDRDSRPVLYGFRATKSVFILDRVVVALGTGITNDDPAQPGSIRTFVESTPWDGQVAFSGATAVAVPTGEPVHQTWPTGPEAEPFVLVEQGGGFRYGVLARRTTGTIHLKLEERPARWAMLDPANKDLPNLPATQRMLNLVIDHGREVVNGRYAYVVDAMPPGPDGRPPAPAFRILAQEEAVHAVGNPEGTSMMAIAFQPGATVRWGGRTMTIQRPGAVLWRSTPEGETFLAADAYQDPSTTSLGLAVSWNPGEHAAVRGRAEGDWLVEVPLPGEPRTGARGELRINRTVTSLP